MKQTEYYDLIVRCLSGEATPQELAELQEWLARSPENRTLFERSEYLWRHSSVVESPRVPDVDSEWQLLENAIKGKQTKKAAILPFRKTPRSNPHPMVGRFVAIAAAMVVIALVRLFFTGADLRSVSTANGQMLTVDLSDGSVVTLNHASRIEFSGDFPESGRKLRLDGEAFFEVAKDPSVFSVQTGNAVVQVLGTKFNVWSREQETRVVVAEGRVSFQSDDGEVILQRGQYSHTRENEPPAEPEPADAGNRPAWMQGKLVFDKTPLGEVVAEITRKYDVGIRLTSSEFASLTVTGSFQNQPLETVLRSLCMTLNLTYKREANGYLLTR